MKKHIKCIELLGALILLLIPCLCLAGLDGEISLDFTPSKTDESVKYLLGLFGTVPGVSLLTLPGNSVTLLGKIFSMFNTGILGISGIFLGYSTFKMVTEAAMSGEAIKSATMWTAMRTGISISLLVPTSSGYSMVNSIVMWIVIQSIGLANSTWNQALEYLKEQKGAPVVEQKIGIDYSLINYNLGDDVKNTTNYSSIGSADVLRSLICARAVEDALKANQKRTPLSSKCTVKKPPDYCANAQKTIGKDVFSYFKDVPSSKRDPEPNLFQFPYINSSDKFFSNYGLTGKDGKTISSISISNLNGICGSISYDVDKNKQLSEDKRKAYIKAKKDGILAMISTLNETTSKALWDQTKNSSTYGNPPLTFDYITSYVLYKDGTKDIGFFKDVSKKTEVEIYNSDNLNLTTEDVRKTSQLPSASVTWPIGVSDMYEAALSYQLSLKSVQAPYKGAANAKRDQELAKAGSQGWIGAGGYYNVLQAIDVMVDSEQKYYKSKACCDIDTSLDGLMIRGTSKPLEDSDTSLKNARNIYPGSIFSISNNSSGSLKQYLYKIDGNDTTLNYLANALNWVYLSVPYAKLYGDSLNPDQSQSESGVNGMRDASDTFSGLGLLCKTTSEGAIDGQMVGGCIMAAMVFVPFANIASIAAIPLLMDIPMCYLIYDVTAVLTKWDCLMGGTGGVGDSCKNSQKLDPILKLHKLGDEMIINAFKYFRQIKWMFLSVSIAFSASAIVMSFLSWAVSWGSFWSSLVGIQNAVVTTAEAGKVLVGMVTAGIYMNIPIGLAMVGPMLLTGITLSIYVPLIPYMLFLFGVISWFISVIVLMAAAPIICFLMLWGGSSQDNPLLSKEAEQFLMQLIGVFFRPTLMVIGLIAGMLLSYIGVNVLNLGFSHIYNNVIFNGTETAGTGIYLVKQLSFVVIYTFSMVSVVNVCFSTIHLLYSEVMRVVGITAPAIGMEERAMEGVKAGLDTFAQAGASGIRENVSAAKGINPSSTFKAGSGVPKEAGKKNAVATGGNNEKSETPGGGTLAK